MGFSGNVVKDVIDLLNYLEKSQWEFKQDFNKLSNLPIIDRERLRSIKMKKDFYAVKTSGSSGIPLSVEKTYQDYVWYLATNIREIRWRKWDMSKDIAVIKPAMKTKDDSSWGIPKEIEPIQGNKYSIGYEPISVLQSWLEEKNPHYIHAYPSIISQLDLSKISNFIDWKGSGEVGGQMFSSEECGTIAIECPDNPSVMHVMENQLVEVDKDGGLIITTTTNPYLVRYKNGDVVELGECNCGRTLQTIKNVKGRIRNMFVLPNGDKQWPLFGSRDYYEKFGIKRFKAIQTSLEELELQIISENLGDREIELISLVKKWINSPINVIIKYVDDFPNYKFEEFISLVK
jgi:phenylacetate-coenzyme A ligase PaaK-like adenylate-forming protein